MENQNAEKYTKKAYPIIIRIIKEEDDKPYYLAHLPDFGEAACSAMGYTAVEALNTLDEVKKIVINLYIDKGKPIPEPTVNHLKDFA